MPKLEEVFGITVKSILSYIARSRVDGKFLEAAQTDHHIVVYGSSKQGKTALRQKHIPTHRCEIYRCSPNTEIATIYQSLLRSAGVRIETTEVRTDGAKAGVKAGFGIKASLPWFGGDANSEASAEGSRQKSLTTEFVGVNFGDAQAVASIFKEAGFNKFVVLENFHYLTQSVQRTLSFDLKTFHEIGIRFIVLGVWREANHLLVLNPDLQDRIAEIPVEPWNEDEFVEVIESGQHHLNVTIPEEARQQFMRSAYGNVGMLQEFLKVYCQLNDVAETEMNPRELNARDSISATLQQKAEDQRGRLLGVLEGIAARSRTDRRKDREEPLTLPYYLVLVLLSAPISELKDGISRKHLLDKIRAIHRRENKETIRNGDVVHLLKRLPELQDLAVSPFLYYDSNQQRLRIVDAGLLFALANVNRQQLAEEILDPLETYDDNVQEFGFDAGPAE